MEPSGTYGDALRAQLLEQDFPVFRVSPKRSHDAAEGIAAFFGKRSPKWKGK